MKNIIISDIHDNEVNLKKGIDFAKQKKVEQIICCGDVTNDKTIGILARNFPGTIHLVSGNIKLFNEEFIKKFNNINYLGQTGVIEIDSVLVGLCHEPYQINDVVEKYAPQIVFYGHTHKPWIEERASIKIVNPGTLGGVFQRASMALWDTDKKDIQLILLENL